MLRIRVYGEKAGLDWQQEEPNTIMVKHADGRQERWRAGSNMPLWDTATEICRTPGGHPEGYLEAFATLYKNFANEIRGGASEAASASEVGFTPGLNEALRGMAFIEAVVDSSEAGGEWRAVSDG